MGQSQSPPKFCARPSSNMFQNNLAQKIKDSAFKKNLSTHAFVRTSNLRDIESKYSKYSDSQNSSCNTSNLKSSKQDFKKKKQTPFFNNHNFTETGQGLHLSDIQQNQAEYQDEETKKFNKTYAYGTQKGTDKSRKASDEKIGLQESKKESVQQVAKIEKESNHQKQKCKSVKHKKQLKINEEKQLKLSDYDQSNLVLFTESKKVSSCKSLEPENVIKSQKNSQLLNADSKYNSNLQLESNKSPSKHQQSGAETYRSVRNSVKVNKIRSENEEFRPTIETRIKSRRAPEVGGALIEEEEEKLQKTVINSRKAPYKDQNSRTIRAQNLYKTSHHVNDNSKGKSHEQHLFRSCKKVYASQISLDSQLSPPQSPSYYQEKQVVRAGVNKLIRSKCFQEDFSIKKDSGQERKSHRQKMRDSISLGRVRKKLAESMHHLHLYQGVESKGFIGKSDDKKLQAQQYKLKGSRLSLSSRLRSKIRQKLSFSKSHSQKSSLSSSQKLSQTHINNSRQKSKELRLSVREAIRKMNEIQQINNLQNTQDNYFNENIDDNTLSPVMYEVKKNKNQSKLRQSIIKQVIRPSEYEIKHVSQETTQDKQKTSNQHSLKLDNKQPRTKMENTKHTKGLYMFTENVIDRFQESTLVKITNIQQNTFKEDKKGHQSKVENKKGQDMHSCKNPNFQYPKTQQNPNIQPNQNTQALQVNQNKQIQQKISQEKPQDKKYKSPRRTEKNPQQIKNSPNYLKQDIQKNHLSVQYSNKKNPQPHDKKSVNLIKFSQLQPNPFDIIENEKLIKTTSAKNYPFHENSKIITNSKLKDSTAKNIEIIDKLINNPINSRSKHKKLINRNYDYEAFVQDLEKLKRIKEIQQKLIKQNLENLKKSSSSHNKVSILDLNKEIINEQITMKVERMNKLKELNKLTKKMDPAMLIKSKSSQLLREQYENLSKTAKVKEKRTDKKHQNSQEKDLYYNFSKQMSNLSHLKDYNQKSSSKVYKSLKQLNASSHEYMIDVSKVQKTKHLKKSKIDSLQLACIPESPQIKYNPWKDHEIGQSKIRTVSQKRNKNSKIQYFANQASRSMDMKRIGNQRETHGAVSLQKTRDKRKLIVF